MRIIPVLAMFLIILSLTGCGCGTYYLNSDESGILSAPVNVAYSHKIKWTDNGGSVTCAFLSGTLPPGILFNECVLSGTPTNTGVYTFTINVSGSATTYCDADGDGIDEQNTDYDSYEQTYTFTVN